MLQRVHLSDRLPDPHAHRSLCRTPRTLALSYTASAPFNTLPCYCVELNPLTVVSGPCSSPAPFSSRSALASTLPPSLPSRALSTMSVSSPPPPVDAASYAALEARNALMNQQGVALQQQVAQLTAQLASANYKGPRVKAPLPPTFTGSGGNMGAVVDSWLDDLQQQFEYYGPVEFPTEVSKIRLATTYLRGPARTWWQHLPLVDIAAITTWDLFVDALHKRFRPALPAELARRKLKDLKQRGTVNQYAGLFQQTLEYIPDKSDADQIFDFRSGLDKAIAARVAEKDPKTLDEAIRIAVQAELYVGRGSTFVGHRGFASNGPSSSSTSSPMELSAISDDHDHDQESSPITRSELLAVLQEQKQEFLNAIKASTKPAAGSASSSAKGPTKLTDAERERCFRENLCLRCRQPGHRANDCPKFANRQDVRLKY